MPGPGGGEGGVLALAVMPGPGGGEGGVLALAVMPGPGGGDEGGMNCERAVRLRQSN